MQSEGRWGAGIGERRDPHSVVMAGGIVRQFRGADSEIGQLRTVLMHRPGLELQRITARHAGRLLFGSLPWVTKARQEHDMLCQELRDQGVEVLYFTQLLQDSLEYQAARDDAVDAAVAQPSLGDELRGQLRAYLQDLGPEQLAQVLIAGLTPEELKIGHGVVFELLDRHDFVLDPVPNLVFTKDSSFWIGDRVAIASLAADRRRRETDLATIVYRYHPRFAGTRWLYESDLEHLDGGDVLLLAPGVVAIGVGQRTTPAGAERLARRLFKAGLAHAVLAVPISQQGGAGHLDTVCAVLDSDTVVMHPAVAYTLTAHTISPRSDGMRMSRARPFLEAASQAMGIDRLHVIDSGMDPIWGQPGQRDDGGNVLAIGPRLAVSHERNSETNARLEAAGVRVIRVPSSELGSLRGGPRCMTCPVSREPAALPAEFLAEPGPAAVPHDPRPAVLAGLAVPDSREASQPGIIEMPPVRAPAAAAAGRPVSLGASSLGATVRPAARATAKAEDPKRQAGDAENQRDHCQPDKGLDDGHGYEHDHDRGHNQEEHAEHSSKLRPPCNLLPDGRRLGLGGRRLGLAAQISAITLHISTLSPS